MDLEVQQKRRQLLQKKISDISYEDWQAYTNLLSRRNLFDCKLQVHRYAIELVNNQGIPDPAEFKRAVSISKVCYACQLIADTISAADKYNSRRRLYFLKENSRHFLSKYPIVDGESHPLEDILQETLSQSDAEAQITQAWEGFLNTPVLAGDFLRCLARISELRKKSWPFKIAEQALKHQSLRVRGAAVTALEYWGANQSIELLLKHTEPVRWLADYIKEVIKDLRQPGG